MGNEVLLLSALMSFILVVVAMPFWIRKCKGIDLLWEDMNKKGHPRNVASSGGVVVIMAFVLGVFTYVALKTFLFSGTVHSTEIFALMSMILILGIVGLVDDFMGWKNGGLSNRVRLILAVIASVPLVVINAGVSIINLPFFGPIEFGILYPLLLIPIGVAGATTTYNFLAGYNGLESGQGILIISFLSFVAYTTGSPWLAMVGICMVFSLFAFYLFNRYPAKVFPGDVLTYSVGAIIAGMAILGNFERIAIIVFIPYILEVILKVRGGLKKHSFAKVDSKGYLNLPYPKFYSLNHVAIWIISRFGKVTEKKVVYVIYLFQIIFILLAFSIL